MLCRTTVRHRPQNASRKSRQREGRPAAAASATDWGSEEKRLKGVADAQ